MTAVISHCGKFRYSLSRFVQEEGVKAALFGVNPSTADALKNDATIRKDIGFAKVNGWSEITKGNVFAYRSTKVKELATCEDPVGEYNWAHIERIVSNADILVPCWGDRKKVPRVLHHHIDRLADYLHASGKPIFTFGFTKGGDPMHPLMLGYATKLQEWKR